MQLPSRLHGNIVHPGVVSIFNETSKQAGQEVRKAWTDPACLEPGTRQAGGKAEHDSGSEKNHENSTINRQYQSQKRISIQFIFCCPYFLQRVGSGEVYQG